MGVLQRVRIEAHHLREVLNEPRERTVQHQCVADCVVLINRFRKHDKRVPDEEVGHVSRNLRVKT